MEKEIDEGSETGSNPDVLEKEMELARSRLQEQRDTLNGFSDEGLRVLRLLLLFITAPAAIVGALNFEILTEIYNLLLSDQSVIDLYFDTFSASIVFQASLGFFAMALVLNTFAMGLEARGIANGSNPNDVFLTYSNGYTKSQYYKMKMEEYVLRIDQNDRVISVMEQFLAVSKTFIMMWGILILTLIYSLFTSQPVGIHVLLIPFLLALFYSRSLPASYMRSDRSEASGPIYSTEYREQFEEADTVGIWGRFSLPNVSLGSIFGGRSNTEQSDSETEEEKEAVK